MVSLPSRAVYAILAVVDVAYHGGDDAVQSRDIAERQGIPHRYLEQILCRLKRAGIVNAKRGPGGGYHLAKPPEAVRVSHILRGLLETEEAKGPKVDSPLARSIERSLREEVWSYFHRITVSDLCREAEALGAAKARPKDIMYFI